MIQSSGEGYVEEAATAAKVRRTVFTKKIPDELPINWLSPSERLRRVPISLYIGIVMS
jgi:hypothetical protein